MKRVAIEIEYYTDIIEIPDNILNKIELYQYQFDKWIYNRENEHEYWIKKNGRKIGVGFGSEAFVDYLNLFCLNGSSEKAKLLEKHASNIPEDITKLVF